MVNFLLNIVLLTWCLPQSTIGFILFIYFKIKGKCYILQYKNNIPVFIIDDSNFSGASLGKFIFLNNHYLFLGKEKVEQTIRHEYGHTIQNYIFGLFYIFIIGIPSMINNIRARFDSQYFKDYYNKFPEKWADKLGGVKRG